MVDAKPMKSMHMKIVDAKPMKSMKARKAMTQLAKPQLMTHRQLITPFATKTCADLAYAIIRVRGQSEKKDQKDLGHLGKT